MIVIKDKDCVYLALRATNFLSDAAADHEWYLLEENATAWKVPNDDNIVMALEGSLFVADLLRYDPDFVRGELTVEKIAGDVLPRLKELLRSFDKLNKNGDMDGACCIAQGGRAFIITPVFDCYEIEDFEATDVDASLALPILDTSKGLPPEERLVFVGNTLQQIECNPVLPLRVINTAACKPYLLGK